MQRFFILIFAVLSFGGLLGGTAQAQQPEQEELRQKMCPRDDCRKDAVVRLKKKGGEVYEKRFSIFPPVVQEDVITILAGETVYVKVHADGEKLSLRDLCRPSKSHRQP
jgi:hypothetical protein